MSSPYYITQPTKRDPFFIAHQPRSFDLERYQEQTACHLDNAYGFFLNSIVGQKRSVKLTVTMVSFNYQIYRHYQIYSIYIHTSPV